jgi:GT2 family glycosyltransferase
MTDEDIRTSPVCAVTVTYGERFALLSAALRGAVAAGVAEIVVAANGVGGDYARQIDRLAAEIGVPMIIVHLTVNLGSASGFAAALRAALERSTSPFLWLLDDDNRPAPEALGALREAFESVAGPEPLALCSLRVDRPNHRRAAAGDAEGAFPPRSNIMGFDWRRFPAQAMRRLRAARPPPTRTSPSHFPIAVAIPWGPYGGLFLHRRTLAAIGYPNEAFRLYGDDTEFTNRILRKGGSLFLAPRSRIDDLEKSWTEGAAPERFFIHRLLAAQSPRRLYLSVRNDVFFTSRYWCDGRTRLLLNAAGFILLTLGAGLVGRRLGAAVLVCRALRDGLAGRLDAEAPAA